MNPTDKAFIPLSMTDHAPAAGVWLRTRDGQAVEVLGPPPANATTLPCRAQGAAEPIQLARGMLCWPPIPAPGSSAATTAPAVAGMAPNRATAHAAPAAAPSNVQPAPAKAPVPRVSKAEAARAAEKARRCELLVQARTLAHEIAAVQREAMASGRPLTPVAALVTARERLVRRRAQH